MPGRVCGMEKIREGQFASVVNHEDPLLFWLGLSSTLSILPPNSENWLHTARLHKLLLFS